MPTPPAPQESLPSPETLEERSKLGKTKEELQDLQRALDMDQEPVSEQEIDKELREYAAAFLETKTSLDRLLKQYYAIREQRGPDGRYVMDEATDAKYREVLSSLMAEYNSLDKPGRIQREEVEGKKKEREEKRETRVNDEKQAIENLIDNEFIDDNSKSLVYTINEFTWGSDESDTTIFFREQLTHYLNSSNPKYSVAKQYLETAKAYIHQKVASGSDNTFDFEEVNDLFCTEDSIRTKASQIRDWYQGNEAKDILEIDESYCDTDGSRYIAWDVLINRAYENRKKKIPKDASPDDKKNYITYLDIQWSLFMGRAYNGKDDWDRDITSEEIKGIIDGKNSFGDEILDFSQWKLKRDLGEL